MEEWKNISSKYEASSYGRIRNFKTGRIIKSFINDNNRELVKIPLNSKERKNYQVHRLVAMAFLENQEDKLTINHIDGNPLNNYVANLEGCTQKENIHHSRKISRNGAVVSVLKIRHLFEKNKNMPISEFINLLIDNCN